MPGSYLPLSIRKIEQLFSLQKDHSDCGVACLQNILRYHGAEVPLEHLRELSGTDKQGTSMLGLYQAANGLGLRAEGAEAEKFENINEVKAPCILHLTVDNRLLHYVVYYPPESVQNHRKGKDNYLIGDPGKGVGYYTKEQLEKVWVTKACLLLEPDPGLLVYTKKTHNKWKWFWALLKENINLLYLAGILGLLVAVLNLSTAIFSQQLVDKILPAKDATRLGIAIGLFAFLLLVRSGISYIRQLLMLRQSVLFNTKLTIGFLRSLLQLSKSFFDNRKTGDLISRLNDTGRIQQAVSYMMGEIGIYALLIIVSIVFIFIYTWKIGVVAVLLLPLVFFIVIKFKKEIIDKQRNLMAGHAHNESNYVDIIKGIGVVMSYNRQPYFLQKSRAVFSLFQDTLFKLGRTKMNFTVWIEMTLVVFLTTVIGFSSALVVQNELKTGELIAVIQMASMLFQNTTAVAMTNIQLQEAKVAFDRMYEFTSFDKSNDQLNYAVSALPFIEQISVENLSFRFPGRSLLFEDVSFTAKHGEIIAIAGQSGTGKSTLLQILHRLYSYESGSITINGTPLESVSVESWRNSCGISSQEVALFSGTLVENIMLGDSAPEGEEVIEFCEQYGFGHYFRNFPQGYGTVLGEGGVSLSGGQKQLVALARCLFRNPQVVLLDEPTAAMDAATEKFVVELLMRLRKDKIIILISHKDSLSAISDCVYLLEAGRIRRQKTVLTDNTLS